MGKVDRRDHHWCVGPKDQMISIPHRPMGKMLCMGYVFQHLFLYLNGFTKRLEALRERFSSQKKKLSAPHRVLVF